MERNKDKLASRADGSSGESERAAGDPFGPATTAKEQLRRWDAGESVWSVEMGGLGPGYEQAIQVLAIEIMRDFMDKPLPEGTFGDWGDSTISRIDYLLPNGKWSMGGFSGAQVGAAKQIAYRFIKDGPRKAMESAPEDRHIHVSKFYPQSPEARLKQCTTAPTRPLQNQRSQIRTLPLRQVPNKEESLSVPGVLTSSQLPPPFQDAVLDCPHCGAVLYFTKKEHHE